MPDYYFQLDLSESCCSSAQIVVFTLICLPNLDQGDPRVTQVWSYFGWQDTLKDMPHYHFQLDLSESCCSSAQIVVFTLIWQPNLDQGDPRVTQVWSYFGWKDTPKDMPDYHFQVDLIKTCCSSAQIVFFTLIKLPFLS